ncbi:MAG: biotin carboxyl carrier protein [Planctomycetota bacterium]
MKYFVKVNGRDHEVVVSEQSDELRVEVDGQALDVTYEEVDRLGQVAMNVDGMAHAVSIEGDANHCHVVMAGYSFDVELEDERERAAHAAERESAGGGVVKSVMPGIVVEMLVAVGDEVQEGQPLLILEAMKMQNEIGSPATACVTAIHVAEGTAVGAGEKLVTLKVGDVAE